MLINNQKIKMKWSTSNREWFENKGYIFTKYRDIFYVKPKDLKPKSDARVKIICDYCNEEYDTEYWIYFNGHNNYPKDACIKCRSKKMSDATRLKRANISWSKLEEICKNKGYELLTKKEEYVDVKMYVNYICPKHGKQRGVLDNLIRGYGCQYCAYESNREKIRLTSNFVSEYISNINNNELLNPDEYSGIHDLNLKIRCGQCGNIFTTSFANYKHGINRCSQCVKSYSVGEKQIQKILEENGVAYEHEKRFENCKDKRSLPFDFYLPDYNICIEFDGRHHFEPVYGDERYSITVKHDLIKNNYCNENNITLIRIPYWESQNINEILKKELKLFNFITQKPQRKQMIYKTKQNKNKQIA